MPDAITFQHYEVLMRSDGTPWELGRGAMGVTYKALDTNLRVPVALKVIHPRQLDSDLVAQRFVREARAAARLRHPHIAAVYHLGQAGENWFYAMEFVAGDTAEGLVKREGPLPEATVVPIAIQAARALNAAAALELVHRDIKPSNLMLTHDGDEWQLKLIDFGLARTFAGTGSEADEDLAAVTHSGFVGTPYYASPEQLEQKELDIRSDLYSLGVTLWFLLTGKVPFTGSVVSVLSQHLHKTPPFEQLDGCTSPALRRLIERMLAKDPAARPQSALELRRELEQCNCAPLPATVSTAPAITAPPPVPAEASIETLASPLPTPESSSYSPGESQFDAAETVAEFGFGRLCRAKEKMSGEPFAVLRIGPLRGLEDSAIAALRQTIERARAIEHPQVWRVHALETDAAESRIVMAWTDGYAWRDLLRRHRELAPGEAFRLLALAAGGIAAILASGIDQPDVSLAGLWCEAPAPDALPTGVKVSPLGVLRTFSLDATFIGEATIAGAAGSESGARGAIRALAEVAYETLGGAMTAPGFPPLPALSEGANKVLRTALRDPSQFASATALIDQLTCAQVEPTPVATFRTPPPVAKQAATQTPEPFARDTAMPPAPLGTDAPIWKEAPAPSPEPLPIAAEDAAASSRDEVRVESAASSDAPLAPSKNSPVTPAVPAFEIEAEPRSRFGGLLIAAGLAVAAGIAWIVFHERGESHPEPAKRPLASLSTPPLSAPTRKPEPLSPTPTPAPIVKPPPTTPLLTPPPPPPPPTPAPPSRAELVRQATDRAEEFAKNQQWEKAASEWLTVRRKFPETPAAADIGMEQLFREIRWRYTPRNDQLPEISKGQVESLVPLAKEAADAGVPAAMMLLGQHFTAADPKTAIGWYQKAAALTPKANTRIGLVLTAQKKPTAAEIAEAWRRFQQAAEAGDLDGRIVVAELLIYGTLANGTEVPGLALDARRGVEMLREVIAAAPKHNSSAPFSNPVSKEPPPPDTGESQPSRAKLALASFLLSMEKLPENKRPEWYRADTTNHGEELRRLLTEASTDRAEALGLLADAAEKGIGGPRDAALAGRFAQQGAERRDPQSMFLRARYLTGVRKPEDMPAEARQLMIEAARKGEPKAIEYCKDAKISF